MKKYTNEIDKILDYYIEDEDWQDSEELKNVVGEFETFLEKLYEDKIISLEYVNDLLINLYAICYVSYGDAFRKGIAIGTGIRKACIDIKM